MTVKAMRTDEEGWKKGDGGPMLEEQVSFNGQEKELKKGLER